MNHMVVWGDEGKWDEKVVGPRWACIGVIGRVRCYVGVEFCLGSLFMWRKWWGVRQENV